MFPLLILFLFAAIGNPGSIGGSVTHEYHYLSDIGEDVVCTCSSCQYSINKTMHKESHCPDCKDTLKEQNSAEVMEKVNF